MINKNFLAVFAEWQYVWGRVETPTLVEIYNDVVLTGETYQIKSNRLNWVFASGESHWGSGTLGQLSIGSIIEDDDYFGRELVFPREGKLSVTLKVTGTTVLARAKAAGLEWVLKGEESQPESLYVEISTVMSFQELMTLVPVHQWLLVEILRQAGFVKESHLILP
jgi:hypothetical protein